MTQYKVIILFAILCGYAFCQQTVTISPTEDTVETVQTNTQVTIQLKGNPTTGYGWYLSNADQIRSSNVIQATNLNDQGSARYVRDSAPPGFTGVGGTYYFDFTTLAPANNVNLIFEYKRPWEPTAANQITVTLQITL